MSGSKDSRGCLTLLPGPSRVAWPDPALWGPGTPDRSSQASAWTRGWGPEKSPRAPARGSLRPSSLSLSLSGCRGQRRARPSGDGSGAGVAVRGAWQGRRGRHEFPAGDLEQGRVRAGLAGLTRAPVSPAESDGLVNGNHALPRSELPQGLGERPRPSHSSLVSSIEKDLQDIMDSLAREEPGAPSKKLSAGARSPESPVVNGGGRYFLSPPLSPGAMSVGSSYDNTSPPFSPLSSPASSGSYTSPSPSSQEQGPATPPVVPVRSSSFNHAMQPPLQRPPPPPYGGCGLDLRSGGVAPSEARLEGSPRMQRRAVQGSPPSPTPGRSAPRPEAWRAGESPQLGAPGQPVPLVLASLSDFAAGGSRGQPASVPSSPQPVPKLQGPSAQRLKMGALQERPPSPFREGREPPGTDRPLAPSPSRQGLARAFQPVEAAGFVHVNQGGRSLQPPESPRLGRRGGESMRELPPLSPSLPRRAAPLPSGPSAHARTTPESPVPQARLVREVPESPRGRRKGAGPLERHEDASSFASLAAAGRNVRARSPSPTFPAELPAPRRPSFGGTLTPAYSLGSLAVPSPRQSPHVQRKLSGDLRLPVGARERKNSITEVSGNEDELLEYHRRQREERLREQEMERLVRGRGGIGGGAGGRVGRSMRVSGAGAAWSVQAVLVPGRRTRPAL